MKLTPLLVQRSAAAKVDWTKIASSLGLRGNTASQLMAFKKRNDEARRKVNVLSEQAQTVDFAYYRGILKNQSIVDELERAVKGFKVQSYDVSRQLKAIDAFEAQAVKNAEDTKGMVENELKDLEKTLSNIESARPFEDLTVVRFSCSRWICGGSTLADTTNRTRLWLLSPRSRSAWRRWSPTTDGCRRATRHAH